MPRAWAFIGISWGKTGKPSIQAGSPRTTNRRLPGGASAASSVSSFVGGRGRELSLVPQVWRRSAIQLASASTVHFLRQRFRDWVTLFAAQARRL